MTLRGKAAMLVALMALGACSRTPRTDAELIGRAQQTVNRKLAAQARYSLMESSVAQQIACGHVSVAGSASHPPIEQDFVYSGQRVILDDDPDFDAAAIRCDAAVNGGVPVDANTADAS
jgi:hypothetical protein